MKTHQKILSAAIASLLLTGAVVPSIADDLEDELQDIQGQIDESRSSQESWQQVIGGCGDFPDILVLGPKYRLYPSYHCYNNRQYAKRGRRCSSRTSL